MNHIYKTVLNKRTGEIQVVSEKTTQCYKSKSGTMEIKSNDDSVDQDLSQATKNKQSIQKSALTVAVGFALTTLLNSTVFAGTFYTGDPNTLITSTSVGGKFEQLLDNSTAQGLLETGTKTEVEGVSTLSGANVTIDYTAGAKPDFIVAGYTYVNDSDTAETVAVINNTINLKQGALDDNVYAGLAHYSKVAADIDCSDQAAGCTEVDSQVKVTNKTLAANNNSVNILDEHSVDVKGDIHAGSVVINSLHAGLSSGSASENSTDIRDSSDANAIANTNTKATAATDIRVNIFSTDENMFAIKGEGHRANDLSVGSAAINISNTNVTGGTAMASAISKATVNGTAMAISQVDANAQAHVAAEVHENTFSADENTFTIMGEGHTFNDLTAGSTTINIENTDITGGFSQVDANAHGHVTANNILPADAIPNGKTIANANAMAITSAQVKKNILSADGNSFGIEGAGHTFNDFTAGSAAINISNTNLSGGATNAKTNSRITTAYSFPRNTGTLTDTVTSNTDATAATEVYENIFSVDGNNFSIEGEGHHFNDLNAGAAAINISTANLTGGSANAKAEAVGRRLGNTTVNSSADSNASTEVYGNVFSVGGNSIHIEGAEHTFNDLRIGSAAINISNADSTGGSAITYADIGGNNTVTATINDHANANATTEVHGNVFSVDEGSFSLQGEGHTFNDLIVGSATIQIANANLTGGSAKTIADSSDANIANMNANASASVETSTEVNNNLFNANNNTIAISGGKNSFNDLIVGSATIQIANANFTGGSATAASKVTAIRANPTPNARAEVNVSAEIKENIFETDRNSVSIEGEGHTFSDLTAGSAAINISSTDLIAGTADADAVMDANSGLADTTPHSHATGDATVNTTVEVQKNKFSANENSFNVEGESHKFNDLNAGSAVINIANTDLSGSSAIANARGNTSFGGSAMLPTGGLTRDAKANATASIELENNIFSVDRNNVNVMGEGHSFNDLVAGIAAIDISNVGLTGGSAISNSGHSSGMSFSNASVFANASAQVNANSNLLNANQNRIALSGKNNSFNDLIVGSTAIQIFNERLIGGESQTNISGHRTFNMKNTATAIANTNANNNSLQVNENIISILGENSSFHNSTVGSAEIRIVNTDLTGGSAEATSHFIFYNYSQPFDESFGPGFTADVSADARTKSNIEVRENTFNADGNRFSVDGAGHIFNDLTAGSTLIDISNEKISAGSAIASAIPYYTGQNAASISVSHANVIADASVSSNIEVNKNIFSTDGNRHDIKGNNHVFNDLNAGLATINIANTGLIAGSAHSSNGKGFGFANINAIANVSSITNVNNNSLKANENVITVSGNNHIFNNLSAGSAAIHLSNEGIKGGTAEVETSTTVFPDKDTEVTGTATAVATATIIVSGNEFNAENNRIDIQGENNTFTNITAGYAGLNINAGNVVGGTEIVDGVESYGDASLTIDASDNVLSASNNSIYLGGSSTINGDMHAGYIDFNIDYGEVKRANGLDGEEVSTNLEGSRATATGNSITIDGRHTLENLDASIYGGYLAYNVEKGLKPESYDVFTGNTLNYANLKPIHIGHLANFQTYNFTLNPEFANTEMALITAKNVNLGSNSSNISDGSNTASDIYVVGVHSGKALEVDNTLILIQADKDQLEGLGQGHVSENVVHQGISLSYEIETHVDHAKDQVIAVVNGVEVNPQLKALLAGNLSGLMLLTRGADDVADNLFGVISEQNKQRGLVPFVTFSSNHSRYDTGSSIKSNGGLLTAGLSFQQDQWTLGLLVENGWDSYKTQNDFAHAQEVKGKGHNRFNGLGLYGHYDFMNGWYTEGSFRGGNLRTRFATDDLRNTVTGEQAAYNISGNYYGAHLMGGYNTALNQANVLDLSLKYLWSGTDSHDVLIAGDQFKFDKLNSHRLRLNAENSYQMNPELSVLTGLGYEYEFEGKATGTTYGIFDVDQSSVKGSTGIATVGLRYQPAATPRLTVDLKGSGYFGQREGGSGLLHMNYAF